MTGKSILGPRTIQQKLERMALEILERTDGEIVLAGIETTGFHLAESIARQLEQVGGEKVPVYRIKINKQNPLEGEVFTDVPANLLNGTTLILVDDVQNSGRTLMYSIRHFLQYPLKSVQTCVLVDRRHNRFPVRADYVGLSLSTTLEEHVKVENGPEGLEAFLI